MYSIITTPATWAGARDDCLVQGGKSLAVINNDVSRNALIKMAAQHPVLREKGGFWLGASKDSAGNFIWVNGLAMSNGATHWNPGEPNGGAAQGCLMQIQAGTWNDAPCSNLYPYVCGECVPDGTAD